LTLRPSKQESENDKPNSQEDKTSEFMSEELRNGCVGIVCFTFILIPILMIVTTFPSDSGLTTLGTGIIVLAFGITICAIVRVCTVDVKPLEYTARTKPAEISVTPPYPDYSKVRERIKSIRREKRDLRTKKSIPGVIKGITEVEPALPKTLRTVKVLRGGEFIGNRMRFKVKVFNESDFIISDVTIYLLSYPQDALRFAGEEAHIFFSKIEPGGFRSPTFDFMPTQDCVRGDIVAGVSFIDERGNPQTLTAKPFVIRAVCDLLIPEQVTPEDFELKLKELECGEITMKIDEWTPREMFDKVLRILDESNFFEVQSEMSGIDSVAFGKISGYARGKYTGKSIGVNITVTGPEGESSATCKIEVSGEDQAMILPAIDDLRERLNAWLCPQCSSSLTLANVEELRRGDVVQCPFCGISIGR
jgi:hypothetical protein